MSSIKLSPNASGTGEFTIAAPNSNTNRTLTLPDATGTVVTKSGTYIAPSELGSGTADSTTFLRGDGAWAAAGSTSNVQQFDSSGTWTKPTAGQTTARIQLWGGGGGGGRQSGAGGTAAGGGGGYNEVTVPLSYLASSVSITVGTGGTGSTSNGVNGGAGGTSSITLSTAVNGRTTIAAYGGGGGGTANTSQIGGSGGGQLSTGGTANNTPGSPSLLIGYTDTGVTEYFGNPQYGGIWHGGGGSASSSPAGGSLFGGGGGAWTTAGTSVWGGNGGVGSNAGTAPGGGGGSSSAGNTNGGSGAAGRVIITCW